ncbi:hypothetical protein CAPTEDRAFT_187815 [Capitella teleta]|uniref:SAM domain-containing protein n=1 Tax=Capitella teleta TaxID=283909 RepID=R7VLE1_CAPTE|nr:hypothetical protein CAPTEDRAFT_187815 [Capitella teleta]|eukprot:ELU17560.1 hypothetical protein CAPTEDRAFT_187815 [Capitella teleta]
MEDDEDYYAPMDNPNRGTERKQEVPVKKNDTKKRNRMLSDEELFVWSEEEYELNSLYSKFQDEPVIVLINGGFYGDTPWETVSSGDVLFLHSKGKQKRAMAVDCANTNRCFSIPLDYSELFVKSDTKRRLSSRKNEGLTLGEVIRDEELPCKVSICSNRCSAFLGTGTESELSIENFEIRDKYDEKFFKGNSILSGSLHKQPIALPVYLKGITVSLAKGMVLGRDDLTDKEKLDEKMSKFLYTAATVDYSPVVPTKEITVFNVDAINNSDGIYDNIEPISFVKFEKKEIMDNEGKSMAPKVKGRVKVEQPQPPQIAPTPRESIRSPTINKPKLQPPGDQSSKSPESPVFCDDAKDDGEGIYDLVRPSCIELKQEEPLANSEYQLAAALPKSPVLGEKGAKPAMKGTLPVNGPQIPPKSRRPNKRTPTINKPKHELPMIPPSISPELAISSNTIAEESPNEIYDTVQPSVLQPKKEEVIAKSSYQFATSHVQPSEVDSRSDIADQKKSQRIALPFDGPKVNPNELELIRTPSQESPVFHNDMVEDEHEIYDTVGSSNIGAEQEDPLKKKSCQLVSDVPQAAAGDNKPVAQERAKTLPVGQSFDGSNMSAKPRELTRRSTINKTKHPVSYYLPDDVMELDTDELVECLHALNLGDMEEIFRVNQIDGELLSSLDEEMMKTDLEMGAFKARKLFKFIHEGWRPSEYLAANR